MEYSPGLPQDTPSLRSCSVNRVKMLLKGQLRIKCRCQYIGHHSSSSQFRQYLMRVTGDALCVTWRLSVYHSLSFSRIQFIPNPRSHTLTIVSNPAELSDLRLCYCNCNAWEWHYLCILTYRRYVNITQTQIQCSFKSL